MRRFILFLFTLSFFAALPTSAQELTIKSFKDTNDLAARQYPRKDANGEACALIKVEVVDKLTKAEGGVVGDIVDNGNEKWVYVIAHQKNLKFHFANHLPVSISTTDYGIAGLAANTTYVLTLTNNSNAAQESMDTGHQYLVMTVSPTNATVLVDGKVEQLGADGTLRLYLPYGDHTYQVLAAGYKEQSGSVNVGKEKTTLNVELTSVEAMLYLTCATAEADIYVNGKQMGTGSWNGKLAAGAYNVEAKCASYRNFSQSITLAENESRTINIPALTPIHGALNVNYSPTDAEVWLDGKQLGTSPDIFSKILIGSHRVEIKKNGYKSQTVSVDIKENETQELKGGLTQIQSTSKATAQNSSTVRSQSTSSQGGQGSRSQDDAIDNAIVEVQATYPGGESALLKFIHENLVYPAVAKEQDLQGVVTLKFCVETDGSIGEIRIIKSLSTECDQAAAKVVKKLRRFTPARQQGKPVPVWFTLSVRFRIQ